MTISRRKFIECAGIASAAIMLSGHTSIASVETVRIGGTAFGASWTIVLDQSADTEALKSQVEQILTRINASMSPYISSSEICQFNAMDVHEQLTPSPALRYVAKAAINIARLTDGAFDPTVGPRVNALGFGPITGAKDINWCAIYSDDQYLSKTEPEATLDLCGIAKGYAVDMVRACLLANGNRSAFIEIGGEVSTIGFHPTGRHWRVAIESPVFEASQAISIVEPRSLCLATSGHRNNGIHGPVSASHIIPSQSEGLAEGRILSVSVLAKTAMNADALATSLCAMEFSDATRFARDRGINALFAVELKHGYRLVSTGRFSEYEIGQKI